MIEDETVSQTSSNSKNVAAHQQYMNQYRNSTQGVKKGP